MRPRSIIAPLLLIVIGVLFLINNLRPDLRYLDVLIQSWPYILIAWVFCAFSKFSFGMHAPGRCRLRAWVAASGRSSFFCAWLARVCFLSTSTNPTDS